MSNVSSNNKKKKKKSCSSSVTKKVHPSPMQSSSSSGDALAAALALLPAALVAVAAPLPDSDKEVLAYLISRSLTPSPSGHHSRRRSSHSSLPVDCGCFDCYTRFWTRWDSSPHRDLIQRVIDDFDDHLSKFEGSPSKRMGRKQRRDKKPPSKPSLLLQEDVDVQEKAPVVHDEEEDGSGESAVEEGGFGEARRSMWPDVMGVLNSRFWSLWCPS